MISQLELDSRAALCRQLAKREPAHEALWLAEAEAGRTSEKFHGSTAANDGAWQNRVSTTTWSGPAFSSSALP
jgi:hypothetical protein